MLMLDMGDMVLAHCPDTLLLHSVTLDNSALCNCVQAHIIQLHIPLSVFISAGNSTAKQLLLLVDAVGGMGTTLNICAM